ncbi:MAG: 2-amino-4-hydroxy-6-hydroxymethyldihydropteridine diphosphokinase [Candidatus Deianiraeaceae bacterium]
MNSCFLGIGTNVGERQNNICLAVTLLQSIATVVLQSSIVETPALLPTNYPSHWDTPFLNIVIKIQTNFSAIQTFIKVKSIEKQMGRKLLAERWSPRIIDIDILTFNNLVYSSNELIIPHANMHQRDFVLRPLCEIAGNDIHHLLGKTYNYLLEAIKGN